MVRRKQARTDGPRTRSHHSSSKAKLRSRTRRTWSLPEFTRQSDRASHLSLTIPHAASEHFWIPHCNESISPLRNCGGSVISRQHSLKTCANSCRLTTVLVSGILHASVAGKISAEGVVLYAKLLVFTGNPMVFAFITAWRVLTVSDRTVFLRHQGNRAA